MPVSRVNRGMAWLLFGDYNPADVCLHYKSSFFHFEMNSIITLINMKENLLYRSVVGSVKSQISFQFGEENGGYRPQLYL